MRGLKELWEVKRKMNLGRRILGILIFMMGQLLFGDIILDADRYQVGEGESFNLRVTVEDKKEKDYNIENIENFKVLGHYTSTSHSIVNGRRSSTYVDTYQVLATEEGIYPLKVVAEYGESNIVDIQVGGSAETPIEEKKYFLKVTPLKESYYFGEKIPYEESLVTTVSNIQDIDYLEYPSFGDISVVEINPGLRIGSIQKRTRVGDRDAIEVVTYQRVLEPSSSGSKVVGGSVMRLSLGGRDIFNGRMANLSGGKKEIEIIPLPGGAPEGFKNIVGRIDGEANLDRDRVDPGEAVTMTVKLKGKGNLKGLTSLYDKRNPDFTIYGNVINEYEWVEDGGYLNEKTFQLAFVPKRGGKLTTPVIEIPYFDSDRGRYDVYTIDPMDIEVTGEVLVPPVEGSARGTAGSVEISQLPERKEPESERSLLLLVLFGIVVVQGGVILYLIRDKISPRRGEDPLKNMGRPGPEDEFYDNYCIFMKREYNFNPKAHSSEKLGAGEEVKRMQRDIEERRFRGEKLPRKEVIGILREEMKGRK